MEFLRCIRLAADDLVSGLRAYPVWTLLAWTEIRTRYRRSALGPFWITLSKAVVICGVGPLYGHLLGFPLSTFVPHLAIGLVIWTTIHSGLIEASSGFILSERYIKEFNLPLSTYIIKTVWKNYIVLAHNAIIVLIVLLIYPQTMEWSLLIVPAALLILAVNLTCMGLLLATFCTRFRDVEQFVTNLLQIVFFVTPILWHPDMLSNHLWLLDANPVYTLIELIRAPLLGRAVQLDLLWAAAITTVASISLALATFGRYRDRIAFWI